MATKGQMTQTVLVDRIDVTSATRGHLYVVSGRGDAGAAVQFSSHHEQRIALCRWALTCGLPIQVTTRRRGWGHELIDVRHPRAGG